MESKVKESPKYYSKRNYYSNNNKLNTENSKCNNNYQNSFISEILKNNKNLKNFTISDKNSLNNVNNIKNNIQNIFSTDESRKKAIKYIMNTRKERRGSTPNYQINNKELFPQEEIKRGGTPGRAEYRANYDLDNNNQCTNKVGNYSKRHILQVSCDNILIDDEELNNHIHNNSKDNYKEKHRKYNKRIIMKVDDEINNALKKNNRRKYNNTSDFEKNKNKISFHNNKRSYDLSNSYNNIKFYQFPFHNNKNYNLTINLDEYNNTKKEEKKENNMEEFNNKEKIEIFPDIKNTQNEKDKDIEKNDNKKEEEKNCINISFSEDGPFISEPNEDNIKKDINELVTDKFNNIKDNNDEENNKIIPVNLHEISFRSFKNENDFFNSNNNSNNNSFDIFEGINKSIKETKNDNNTYKNKLLIQCSESKFNIINNNNNFYINEIKKLKEENNNNKNEINNLKKEKDLCNNEIKKLKNENELLKQKINEIYYAYQEVYKICMTLKEENEKFKKENNSNPKKNNNYIESNVNINLKKSPYNNKKETNNIKINNNNIKNKDKNLDKEEKYFEEKKIKNEGKNGDNNDGILNKAMSKFMHFFNENKKNEDEPI